MNLLGLSNPTKFFLAIVLLGLFAFALGFLPNRWQQICIMWAIWSTVGMSWLVILRVGEFSVGQAGFLCIGGYSAAVLMLKFDCPFWLALIVSAATCAF